jgi:hypothetical protein
MLLLSVLLVGGPGWPVPIVGLGAVPIASGSLTVEGGDGWELTFHEPVIAGGRINTTKLHQEDQLQMLSNSLAITCLFFGIEEGRAKHIFSPEQYYGHGAYAAQPIGMPYAFSSDGGASWNQSGCPDRCHDRPGQQWVGSKGPVMPPGYQGEALVAMVPNQAFFARDKPGTLRGVGGDSLCACAGETCSSASLINKTGRPYGGCRPETRPAPPWWNFSSARTLEYTADPSTGMPNSRMVERQVTFTGLPRGVWYACVHLIHAIIRVLIFILVY